MDIRAAAPSDLDALTALLTETFAPDPLMQAICAPAPDPLAALEHLNRVELGEFYLAHPAAHVDVAEEAGQVLGTMLWVAPEGVTAESHSWGFDPAILGDAAALIELDEAQCEAAAPQVTHWYAYMIAVSSAARGKGVGSALMARGLERVDAAGLPAHLESTTPRSRALYERFGFRTVAELSTDPLPTYWAMTRPATHTHA